MGHKSVFNGGFFAIAASIALCLSLYLGFSAAMGARAFAHMAPWYQSWGQLAAALLDVLGILCIAIFRGHLKGLLYPVFGLFAPTALLSVLGFFDAGEAGGIWSSTFCAFASILLFLLPIYTVLCGFLWRPTGSAA